MCNYVHVMLQTPRRHISMSQTSETLITWYKAEVWFFTSDNLWVADGDGFRTECMLISCVINPTHDAPQNSNKKRSGLLMKSA